MPAVPKPSEAEKKVKNAEPLSELRMMGEIYKSEAMRPTLKGGHATVWMIVRKS